MWYFRLHRISRRVANQLYPNKRMTVTQLHLSHEEIIKLLSDIEKYGGFNTEQRNGKLYNIWLSSEGKRQYKNRPINTFRKFIKNNWQKLIQILLQ